jgi:hypothetical protein
MPIPDLLYHEEPVVEHETLIATREWYSWLSTLVDEIRAELKTIKDRLDALEGP